MRKTLFITLMVLLLLLVLPYTLTRFSPISSRLGGWVAAKISQKSGFDVEIGQLRFTLPFYLILEGVSVSSSDHKVAESDKIRIAWSPLRLFKGELSFPIIESREISLFLSEGERLGPPIPKEWPCSPIGLHLGNGRVDELILYSGGKESSRAALSQGEFTFHPKCSDFFASVTIQKLGADPIWQLSLIGDSAAQEVSLVAIGKELGESTDRPISATQLETSIVGSLADWWQLLAPPPFSPKPLLYGQIEAELAPNPYAPLLYKMIGKEARASGYLYIDSALSLHLVDLELVGNDLQLTASGEITKNGSIVNGYFSGELFELSALLTDPLLVVRGGLEIDGTLSGPITTPTVAIHFTSPLLLFDRIPLYTPRGSIEWQYGAQGFYGTLQVEGFSGKSPLRLSTAFAERRGGSIALPNIRLHGEGVDLSGSLLLDKERERSSGELHGRLQSLAPWSPSIDANLEGGGTVAMSLKPRQEGTPQQLTLDLNGCAIIYNQFEVDRLKLQLALQNPFRGVRSGTITAQMGGVRFGLLCFQEAKVELQPTLSGWAFAASAQGGRSWIQTQGLFTPTSKMATLRLDQLDGSLQGERFQLEAPLVASYAPKSALSLSPSRLLFGNGSFALAAELSPSMSRVKADIRSFPLSWLAPLSLGPPLEGELSGQIDLKGENNETSGTARLEWQGIALAGSRRPSDRPIAGWIELKLDKNRAALRAHSAPTGVSPLDLALDLPLQVQLMPFTLVVPPGEKVAGQIAYSGAIGPMSRTLLFRNALLEGEIALDLSLQGSSSALELRGWVEIQKGHYTNLRMGTTLANLTASAVAKGDKLVLTSLSASDECGGTLSAKGELAVQLQELFPFRLEIDLNRIVLFDMEDVRVQFSGPLLFSGNLQKPLLSGHVIVPGAELKIPDRIRPTIPTLEATYINPPQVVQAKEKRSRSNPCQLDLQLDILPNVSLIGRGLNSTWRGDLTVQGTTSEPDALGQLELVEGCFRFSDHIFQLVQGRMGFDGPLEVATLELVATLCAQGVDVIASLAGKVDNPKLTLRSVPPLPLREVLSLVLFNAPIDEITPFQALQLAAATAELSGGAMIPNPLRTIQCKLGLDHLTIVRPDHSTDEIGIEGGRHIGRYGYLTLYRSLQQQYNHMLLELDLFEQWQVYTEIQDTEGETFGVRWKKDY